MTAFDDLSAQDQELARSLQATLRANESLDYVTAAKLRAARARALSHTKRAARSWLFASSGLTAAAIVAVVLVLRMPHSGVPVATEAPASSQVEALDVLTDDVDADFYEDLDLYQWLARNQDGAA